MATLGTYFKNRLLSLISSLTNRHAVLLPAQARCEESILDLHAPYRVEGPTLTVQLRESCPGQITVTLLAYNGHFPTNTVWTSAVHDYAGPCDMIFDFTSGTVLLADHKLDRVPLPLPTRRFAWQFTLTSPDGLRRERITGHYLPADGRAVDASYFQGDDYVDYESQSAGEPEQVLRLLQQYRAQGPVLEVGCATGGLLEALDVVGLPSVGLDISEWAVGRVAQRLGPDRAWVCDVENDQLPDEVVSRHPIGALVLWAVFEHFREPFVVLAKLTELTEPGTILLINTTNVQSLTHTLFGRQWEGYFDWTHLGVDRVSTQTLREELPRLGWRIEQLTTHLVWDGDVNPTHATLREWWAADARFRRLITEHDLGDLITCVAVKEWAHV